MAGRKLEAWAAVTRQGPFSVSYDRRRAEGALSNAGSGFLVRMVRAPTTSEKHMARLEKAVVKAAMKWRNVDDPTSRAELLRAVSKLEERLLWAKKL